MKKILIVDDAETVLQYEKMLLSGSGYEILTAVNGIEALKKIKEDTPDLILLDLIMPKMDGITCCRIIRGNDKTKSIPIIMVTTVAEKDRVEECFKAGCDDYIFKPIKKIELLAKVEKFLST